MPHQARLTAALIHINRQLEHIARVSQQPYPPRELHAVRVELERVKRVLQGDENSSVESCTAYAVCIRFRLPTAYKPHTVLDMETTTTLYHGSPEQLSEIRNEGMFGGIFASGRDAAEAHGTGNNVIHSIDLEDSEILDLISRVDFEIIEAVIRQHTAASTDDEIQSVFEAVDSDDADGVESLLLVEQEDCYLSWEIQHLRGLIAKAAGYKAVECEDEYGTSYLILPGTKIEVAQ